MSCSRFIASVLAPCATARLAQTVAERAPMWTASWAQASTLDGTSMKTLLTALARLPVSASVAPPRLHDVMAVVAAFLRHVSDANNVLGTGLSLEEAKLSAVEVVEKVFQRLTKFTWTDARDDVHSALGDMLADADRLLEPRYPTHRKARERVMLLFAELDKPWIIRTSNKDDDEHGVDADDADATAVSPWKRPTVAWLSDWNNFQPSKLPAMKVPGGRGDGVYETPDEYFDTTIKLWTGMTFIDGHNALLPHCTLQTNGKVCDQPLWPMQAKGFANYQCRTRGCGRLVEYVCAHRMHQVGLCQPCALDRQQKLRGPPSDRASTHIYDAAVRVIRYDGKMYLTDVASRRPPMTPIHWKTTRRLSSPNLVGIVLLSSRGGSLKLTDEIYWAKVALHGQPREEFRERENGRLALELLEYSVDETGNPLLAKEVEQGAHVAIIDCQTFVPEFVPVLKALERQREMPMPFQSGALVNLKRVRGRHHCDVLDIALSASLVEDSDEDVDDATPQPDLPLALDANAIRSLIVALVDDSLLDPIVQIRRDASAAEQLRQALVSLVTQATLDRGQLVSFIEALFHPVHCTQGPPGTGKSYLGVVVVRALLVIRKLWMQVSPSVGEPPILVLSYKNHAIDEFLMDLVKAEASIRTGRSSLVRLGGGCTEPTLSRYQESNVIASNTEVVKLADKLDSLHQLASKIRRFRNSFGVIYESHVLVTDQGQGNESDDAETTRNRNKVIAQAASELATAAATVGGVLKELESESDDAAGEGPSPTEPKDPAAIVKAAEKKIAKKAKLSQEDVKALYAGIRHYDPAMDPVEILFKWMNGFVPLPPCAYEEEDCSNLVDPTEGIFCKQHHCHFSSTAAGFEALPCEHPVALGTGFCHVHLCSIEDCGAPVFRDKQLLCSRHACFVCIREKPEDAQVLAADDAPPRNTCVEHPLCWWASRGVQCDNVVLSMDSSFCPEHSVSKCEGKTPSGDPCPNISISKTTPFCHSHFSQYDTSAVDKTDSTGSGKCAATNAKGKPCKGTPKPGMMYCVNHAAKNAPRDEPSTAQLDTLNHEDAAGASLPVDVKNPSDVEATTIADGVISELDETSAQNDGLEQATDDAGAVDESEDAASDASGSFVDLAIDQALTNLEEDYDEPDHIQHLRDVDEVDVGGADEDELSFDDDESQYDETYSGEIEEESLEYSTKRVGEWHWEMSLNERWQAIRALLSSWDPLAHTMIQAIRQQFEQTKRQLQDERSRAKTKMYEGKAIIGGTITGCVTRLEAIRATKPFAILVEEASEVLEPLLFACLGSTTCKLEMIGDHLQLQPSVMSKFDFERINKINISMFERLIRAPGDYEVPSSVLSLQRRMRKNIADLTREFYTEITLIEDHECCRTKVIQSPQAISPVRSKYGQRVRAPLDKVKLTPSRGREVPGVGPHLFFWTHGGREEKARVGLSRMNTHEADMACYLAKYLVDCGVPAKSIAILTPYKGQLMHMRYILMSPQFGMSTMGRDSRREPTCTLSTVDRFQGDEADVVIVSLVIDGKSKTPFVKLQNRMIVLLSRARIGMYVLGNIDYFTNATTSAPAHWQATLDKLSLPAPSSDNTPGVDAVWPSYDQPRLGAALPLCCPQHRNSVHSVQNPKELKLSFCQVVCRHTLGCSHECGQRCHWATSDQHTAKCSVQVDSPCMRHPKTLKCADVCQTSARANIVDALGVYRCDTLVDLQLPCTHVQRVACADEVDVLEKKRGWPKCTENAITPFVYPECKHELSCKCDAFHAYQNGATRPPNCSIDVEYVPPCGHTTKLKCYARMAIVEGQNQFVCTQKVKVVLPRCAHDVAIACSTATSLRSWSGASCTTFGVVEEGIVYGPADHPCAKKVTFRRRCGHETQVQCSAAFNMASTEPPCPDAVSLTNPECGHIYATTCSDARRIQQRLNPTNTSLSSMPAVTVVNEEERSSVYRNFGLNVACKTNVTLRRKCDHEQDLPCHQARSTSEPCRKSTSTKRPDCGHNVTLPCALMGELQSWQPWSGIASGQQTAADLLASSGIVSMSLPAPARPISSAFQSALSPCKLSVILRRDTSCGHEGRIPCGQAMKILRGEASAPLCNQLTSKSLGCGHTTEVACCVEVAKYRCKEKVGVPCWNASVCHQTVEAQCALVTGKAPVKNQCQSRTVWTCASGKHKYHVAVCSKGEPTACPGCSHDALVATLERVRIICSTAQVGSVPWPPTDMPAHATDIPAFGNPTELRDRAKLEFYRRQLNVLERFRAWIEQDEDIWSRALFQPMYLPVFTVVDASKTTVMNPVMRFELKDFASTATWNNIEAYPVVPANAAQMIPPVGGKKSPPSTRRVVFGVVFSVGVNVSPSDAPSQGSKFGPNHGKWIETQLQERGFDCAFFAKKKDGVLSNGGTLRVWDPYSMFPTGEATVQAAQRSVIVKSLEDFATTVKMLCELPPARFLVFKPRAELPTSQASDITTEGSSQVSSVLSPQEEATCRELLEALPFPWAATIRLYYPWSGMPMLVGQTNLPESVEKQMLDKLAFLRSLGGHGGKKPAKGGMPFIGINFLKSVTDKQPFEEADLFTALELLEVQKTTTKDAQAKLEQYVSHVKLQCHPLVLLALARLVARDKSPSRVQPEEFVALFQTLYPEAAKLCLSVAEHAMLAKKAALKQDKSVTTPDESKMSVLERWEKLKTEQNCSSTAMDELLKMVGLDRVKRFAINMFKSALAYQHMTPSQRKKNAMAMNYCFVGNPGTGKTTVAKLFARILKDSGMRRNSNALLRGAQELKDSGADKFRDEIKKAMGGVVFVDEAYELEPSSDPKGKPIVAEILVAAEEHRHDLSMILAGYEDDIQQKLYAYNDGLRSRFTEVVFDDFDEADLRVIWDGLLKEREWSCEDKVSTIACRRLARGAGRKGFGNARDVRQLFEHATAEAMAREDFGGIMELRAVDVIGERPSKNPKLEVLVRELNGKIGWKRIKERVRELIDICDANYERELNGHQTLSVVMNRMFLGNPGTGKTTCATLYGKLLKHLGFLSNGEVLKKTAGDFVGQYIGQSQTKTNEILKLAKGKVLIIDEAYNLNDQWYGKQVLDVLVEKVQGSDTDDIAVILIGYEHQMTEMLRTQNPGLARRFPIEYAFFFDDYDDQELFDIFSAACERKNVDCPLDVAQEVVKILSMQRRQANFGNAGAVEMLLKNALANASKRPMQSGETHMVLQLEDIENEMSKRANDDGEESKEPEDPLYMLDKLYRMDNIKEELQRLRTRIHVAEEEGEERPEIGHFVFRGSPGTGKTTVARTMGKILHRMGLLGSDRVVETSGLNMTGEYVGQTKKKVEEQLGQARGAILFIDEAYELGKGHFGEEAMTTLVAAMTDPTYDGMVIIIAGYPADMDAMLDRNAGLKSRFTRFLEFPDWETSDCIAFMQSRSSREKYALTDDAIDRLEDLFTSLRSLPGFGNGRDVDKVWKSILECRAQRVVGQPELERTITLSDVETASQRVLAAREPPKTARLSRPDMRGYAHLQSASPSNEPPQVELITATTTESKPVQAKEGTEEDVATSDDGARDPGVSDDVWEELERAKEAYKQMLQDMKDAEDRKKQEESRRKAEEYKATQKKLRHLAKCPAGYEWHQVGGGWRCGGGSHFVTNETLEKSFMY